MIIRFFREGDTEALADLLCDMSRHYNGDNASSRAVVRQNLVDNILGSDSHVRIVVAVDETRVVGAAMISLMYPAPKERAQLFMKELYVAADARSCGIGHRLMGWIAHFCCGPQLHPVRLDR
jgi:predicted N-acetyltransferase YhbS